jgi:hypothetical protein
MASLRNQLDFERRKVDVDYSDITIRELHRMLSERELNAAPAYQRKFRWTEGAESRLIESILLGLPVPSIFVATNEDFTWEVVDGLQRLSSIAHFVGESERLLEQVDKKAPLRLTGLDTLTELEGKSYSELDEDVKLYFMRRTLRVTALSDKSDLQVRFDLFERLNGGAVSLTPQEVRACIYRGAFNDLLDDLAADSQFRDIVKLKANAENDGTREELVLKFFAYLYNRDEFRQWVTRFLNNYMQAATRSFELEEGRAIFARTVSHLHAVLGGEPFLRKNTNVTPLNQLEAVLVGIAEVIRSGSEPGVPPAGWADDEELVTASTKGTNTVANLRRRIDRARTLFS